jgi:hypothetical protein
MIENTGSMKILDAQVRMVGTEGIFQNDSVLNETLETGASVIVNVSYDPEELGAFRQVKVVPRISLPGQVERAYCTDSGISVTGVPNNCTTYE